MSDRQDSTQFDGEGSPDGGAGAQATQKRRPRARKKVAFLDAVAMHGTVQAAAAGAGVHRATHYRWLDNDPEYAAAFEEARETFRDQVRNEVKRRGIDGWDEPVIYQGQNPKDDKGRGVTVRKYSDRMLELLAKAVCPEFRDKVAVTGEGGGPLEIKVVRYPVKIDDMHEWSAKYRTEAAEADKRRRALQDEE
jgi:hypothetical protein